MPRVYPGSPPPPVQIPVSPARRIPSSHGTRRPPPRKHYETASLYSLKRNAHARLHRQAHSAPALHPSAVDPACVAVVRGLSYRTDENALRKQFGCAEASLALWQNGFSRGWGLLRFDCLLYTSPSPRD